MSGERKIDPGSPAAAHGVGLFETVLVYRGRAVRLPEHLIRLQRSCIELGFAPPATAHVDAAVAGALQSVPGPGECALRLTYLLERDDPADGDAWLLDAGLRPLPAVTLARRSEGRVVTLPPTLRRSLPGHKLTSYAVCDLALRRAVAAGSDEALFVDGSGRMLEGTATNLFVMRDEDLVTPPLKAGVLPGIVRQWVLENGARVGSRVVEEMVGPEDVRGGSFLTSSLTLLAPVRALDGVACAPLPQSFDRLRALYLREVLERS